MMGSQIYHRFARRRGPVSNQAGFTLLELLVVLLILTILVAVAVPAYLRLSAGAEDATVKADLRTAVPAAEAFAADNTGAKGDADNNKNTTGYKGMTAAILETRYDTGLPSGLTVVSGKTTATQYCLTDTQGSSTWSLLGPGPISFFDDAKCK